MSRMAQSIATRTAPPATVAQLFDYLESFTNLERGGYRPRAYRLERMQRLLDAFDSPHIGRRTIHLAGSKGKGSTACFIAAGIHSAGHKVGLYCSPHVSDYRERITIGGRYVQSEAIVAEGRSIYNFVEPMRTHENAAEELPTTFELLTLLAFLLFRREKCDAQVIETGIGGRLDATNLCRPDITVITPIEREHTDYLGNLLTGIAREKGGIIKEGIPVCIAPQRPAVRRVLIEIASRRNARIVHDGRRLRTRDVIIDSGGTRFSYIGPGETSRPIRIGMIGTAQAENAVIALQTLSALYPDVPPETFESAVVAAGLPGRMELVAGSPQLLLDGAHTPHSIRRLLENASRVLTPPYTILFGSVHGKDHAAMARLLTPHAGRVIVSTPGTFKRSEPETVAESFRAEGAHVQLLLDPVDALSEALGSADDILVCGSFFMVSEIRRHLIDSDRIHPKFDAFTRPGS